MAYPIITLDLRLLPPGRMTAPRILGGAVESGMSLSGLSTASDTTGGGIVAVDYDMIWVGNADQARMRYFSRLAAMLSSRVRPIIVPLMTDFYAPIDVVMQQSFSRDFDASFTVDSRVIGDASAVAVAFNDGSGFSDGSFFSQATLSGAVSGSYSAGQATITLSLVGGRGQIVGGEWFGVTHPTRGKRAYCITDVDSSFVSGGVKYYTVGIRPTLRDTLVDLSPVTWWRPQCLMRLAPGFAPDMQVENYWMTTPSLRFVEAF